MTDLEALCTSVLSGRMPVSEGLRGLSLYAVADLRSNPAYVHYKKGGAPHLLMEPRDVAAGLRRYLTGEIHTQELQDWASFVTLTGAFHGPEPPPDDEDWYVEMWEVLHELATPAVAGQITPQGVRDKLTRLGRYDVRAA